jgi:hypothetical protein
MTQNPSGAKPRVLSRALFAALGAAVYLLIFVDNSSTVAEDAAIVRRYSQHSARGFGYVWNVGEPPLAGATDWLGRRC